MKITRTYNPMYILVIIIGVSISLRVGAALYMGNQVVELPGTADQVSYHSLALRVLEGHGFSFADAWWPVTAAGAPTAHWSYLYTFYLVFIYWIFGPNPLIARLIQAVLVGLLHPYLAYLIGQRAFNSAIGLAAAGLSAVYIYFIYYAGTLMSEPFYITSLLASLYLAMLLPSQKQNGLGDDSVRKRYLLEVLFGITLGVTVLLRQLYLLVIPFLFIWLFLAEHKSNIFLSLRSIFASCLILIVMVIPFTIYNYIRFDQFVLLNTNSGYAFFWGNHPIHGTGFIPILPSATYRKLIPEELRDLNEAALDKALLQRGIEFVIEDPVRYFDMSISRIPAYYKFWPSGDSSLISNFSRVASFGLCLPFMMYGVVKSFGFYKQISVLDFVGSPLMLLFLVISVYSTIHLLTWALIRYRLPVDAILLVFAGISIIDIYIHLSKYFVMKNSVSVSERQG